MRANTVPPPPRVRDPQSHDNFVNWAKKTFQVGTRVRIKHGVQYIFGSTRIPPRSVGRVVSVGDSSVVFEFEFDEPLFTSSRRRTVRLVEKYDDWPADNIEVLDDNWGPLTIAGPSRATPGQTSGWQRQLSTSRKYRAMKPNTAERPAGNSAMVRAWVERTYAPGTPVKLLQPWKLSLFEEVPAGARGEVTWVGMRSGLPLIHVEISDARDSSGQRMTHLVGNVLSVEDVESGYGPPVEEVLAPLVDNWATPASPSKHHHSRGQTQGWQRQLSQSRKYRTMKPNGDWLDDPEWAGTFGLPGGFHGVVFERRGREHPFETRIIDSKSGRVVETMFFDTMDEVHELTPGVARALSTDLSSNGRRRR